MSKDQIQKIEEWADVAVRGGLLCDIGYQHIKALVAEIRRYKEVVSELRV